MRSRSQADEDLIRLLPLPLAQLYRRAHNAKTPLDRHHHAFYLAAKTLGGETWPVLGSVWYATLTTRLSANAKFRDFARATVAMAGDLYGHGGTVQGTVAAA